ncbi:MAG: hypothetical protein ABIL68_07280 [bacterium]
MKIPKHEPFRFKSSAELLQKAEALGVVLPFREDISTLFESISIGSKSIPNRLVVQPMEGFDAEPDGSPGELAYRRYRRYAEGGSGLVWSEATSVVQTGRSNPRQLLITKKSLDGFKKLVEQTRKSASSSDLFLVLQITHSGRYARPEGKPRPQIPWPNPYLNKSDQRAVQLSDDDLRQLRDFFVESFRLAKDAGFDAVDIKACHGYLIHELLGASQRKNSRYGGSFVNRIRFLTEIVERGRHIVPDIAAAVRLSVTDNIPHPYGFGVPDDGSIRADLTEPIKLIERLIRIGCSLFNITVGNPYYSPHWVRPYDRPAECGNIPEEHPLQSIVRLIQATKELQKTFPEIPLVGSGYSWLRRFFPHVGAAVIRSNAAHFIGLGRGMFAYPNISKDLAETGSLNPKKVCIACSRCTELMRNDRITGCVIHDKKIYGREYKKIK